MPRVAGVASMPLALLAVACRQASLPDARARADASEGRSAKNPETAAMTYDSEPPFSGSGRPQSLPPTLALVRLVGRFDVTGAAVRFAWPGSSVEVAFQGTGLDVELDDSGTNYSVVRVDDGPATPLASSSATSVYTLASNLPPGRHTLRLTKRTESYVGVMSIRRFLPHGGALAPVRAQPYRARLIEFVGDSITCGYGNLGGDPERPFTPETEDETQAYGALAAAALGAEHTAIAYSGIGVFRDHSGDGSQTMAVRYERTLADDPSSAYRFDPPSPDVLVVNLGTNDFAAGDPGPAFERAYLAFLHQLRRHHPGARIVATLSPMITDAWPAGALLRSKAASAIQNAVREFRAEGAGEIDYFAFDEQREEDGYGCNYHPSRKTHERMATKLASFLRDGMK